MSKNTQNGSSVVGALLAVALVVTMVVGWVLNIIAIAGSTFDVITGEIVLRIIGVFIFPIGAIMGLFV